LRGKDTTMTERERESESELRVATRRISDFWH